MRWVPSACLELAILADSFIDIDLCSKQIAMLVVCSSLGKGRKQWGNVSKLKIVDSLVHAEHINFHRRAVIMELTALMDSKLHGFGLKSKGDTFEAGQRILTMAPMLEMETWNRDDPGASR